MAQTFRQFVSSVAYDSSVRRLVMLALALGISLTMNSPIGGGTGA